MLKGSGFRVHTGKKLRLRALEIRGWGLTEPGCGPSGSGTLLVDPFLRTTALRVRVQSLGFKGLGLGLERFWVRV